MAKGKYKEWLEPDKLLLLKCWARDGLTDEQIAKNIGITSSTLYDWKIKHSEISEALSKGKDVADYEVECALKKRAEGYDVWEEEEIYSVELQKWIPVKRKKKHIPADTTATSMWLRNRKPDKWRDKPEPLEIDITEDSGLMKALKECANNIFDDNDDADMLPPEDEE